MPAEVPALGAPDGTVVRAHGLPGDAAPPGATARPLEDLSLQALLELSQEIHTTGDLYRVAELGLLKIMGHLGTASSALWIRSDQTRRPVLLRSLGIPERVAAALSEVCVDRIMAPDNADPTPVFVEDCSSDLGPGELSLARAAGISLFGLLCSSGRVIGAIALGRRVTGSPYAAAQLRILQASLLHLGVALENTLLYASTLEQNRELRATRARLQELDELKRQFVDNLRHELRTPLTVILSYADLLRAGRLDPEAAAPLLGELSEQAQHLRGLIENLLTFSDLKTDRLGLTLARQDIAGFLRDYFTERRPGLARDLRELTLRLEPSLPPATADLARLRQILDELVGNAAKFTPEGGRIALRALRETRAGGPLVVIEIADNGPGISSERLAAAFEPFRQLDGSLAREAGGVGLGLPLARELARRMGGDLELTVSDAGGTRCLVLLPQA